MLTPSPLNFRVGPQRGASLPGSRIGSGPAGWGPVGARLGLGLGGAASSLQTLTCWGWSPGRGQSSPACRGGGPARRLRSLHGHEARGGVPGGRRSPGQRQMCLGRSARSSVAPVGGGTGRLAPRLPGGAPVCVSWPLGRTRGTHGCHGEGSSSPPQPSSAVAPADSSAPAQPQEEQRSGSWLCRPCAAALHTVGPKPHTWRECRGGSCSALCRWPSCRVLEGPRSPGRGGVGRSWGPVGQWPAREPCRRQPPSHSGHRGQGLVPESAVLLAGPRVISQAQVTFLGGPSPGHEGFRLSGWPRSGWKLGWLLPRSHEASLAGAGGEGGRVSHRPWGPRGQSLPLGSVWFLGAPHPTPRLPGPAPSWADHRFSANQRAFQSNTSVSG